jgi:hypothetical protein
MGTIKGPITIEKGKLNEFLSQCDSINVKLPFTATNFRPTKIPKGVNLDGIHLHKDAPKEGEEKEINVKKVVEKVVKKNKSKKLIGRKKKKK